MNNQQHLDEIQLNQRCWQRKPLLRKIYSRFYSHIRDQLSVPHDRPGDPPKTLELGSGIGNIKAFIPDAISTDLFPNPWIDQVENVYKLSFEDGELHNIILFDVFHHLQYPGSALDECWRVLKPAGRVLIFDPCVSLLGLAVYGLFHHEPIGLRGEIESHPPAGWTPEAADYYAAQGNAYRIFYSQRSPVALANWELVYRRRYAAISYIASGGYSKPQLYPTQMLPAAEWVDWVCDWLPGLFATRLLVVLEKSPFSSVSQPA